MQYHLAVDLDLNKEISTNLISYNGVNIIKVEINYDFEAPEGFNSLGDEYYGFDIKQFIADHLSYDTFQYVDGNGNYNTVTLYDHSGAHLAEFAKMETSLVERVEQELQDHMVTHYDIDFTI